MNRRQAIKAGVAAVLGAPIAAEAIINHTPPAKYVIGADVASGDGITYITAFFIDPDSNELVPVYCTNWKSSHCSQSELTERVREAYKTTKFTHPLPQPSGVVS